jgi:hypothetical protein
LNVRTLPDTDISEGRSDQPVQSATVAPERSPEQWKALTQREADV